jgi:hypothetical protein
MKTTEASSSTRSLFATTLVVVVTVMLFTATSQEQVHRASGQVPDPELGTKKNEDGGTATVESDTTYDPDGRKITTKDSKGQVIEVEYTGRLRGHSMRDVYERTTYKFDLDYAETGGRTITKETYDNTETDDPDLKHQTITKIFGPGRVISQIDFTYENGVMSGRKETVTDPTTGKTMMIEEKYSLPPAELKIIDAKFNGDKIDPKHASEKGEEVSRFSDGVVIKLLDAARKERNKTDEDGKKANKEPPKQLPRSKPDSTSVNPCLIGTWRSESPATFYDSDQAAMRMNGAGLAFIVERDGTATFDYSGVKPLLTERHYGNDVVKVTTTVKGMATARLLDPYNYLIAARDKTLRSTVTFTENYSDESADVIYTEQQKFYLPFEKDVVRYRCSPETLTFEYWTDATLTFTRVN